MKLVRESISNFERGKEPKETLLVGKYRKLSKGDIIYVKFNEKHFKLEDNILMMVELIKNKWEDCEVLYKYSLKKKRTIKSRNQLKVVFNTYILSGEQSNIFPKDNDVKDIKIIIDGNRKSDVINKQTDI